MGFILYTQNGSFNPASYGLTVGDVLFVKAVGGGGGGMGADGGTATVNATNGGASSFGSLLTAAGGLAGVLNPETGAQIFKQAYAHAPGINNIDAVKYGDANWYYGGAGADGWLPGAKCSDGICPLLYVPIVPTSTGFGTIPPAASMMLAGRPCNFSEYDTMDAIYTASDNPFSHAGGIPVPSGNRYITIGGLGYGAGGGGSGASSGGGTFATGGGSGQIRDLVYTLPNLNTIPITVGAGGTGYYRSSYSSRSGGGGARGCVAIWW